jgi:hypothetical protein
MAMENIYQYEKCLDILDEYIAFARWLYYDHSPIYTAGDGVAPFMHDVSLSLYLYLPDGTESITLVLCSYLAVPR